jgi:hypothetical protein
MLINHLFKLLLQTYNLLFSGTFRDQFSFRIEIFIIIFEVLGRA